MSDSVPRKNRGGEGCLECVRLLEAYTSAARATREVIETKERAAWAGIFDDIDFLGLEANLDNALIEQQRAREAYADHRMECHGEANQA